MKVKKSTPLRRALRRLTDPNLISWPFFWISLAAWLVSFYPQAFRSETPFTSDLIIGWVVGVIGGQIALFTFLLIARRLWWRTKAMANHPALAVWSFIVGMILAVTTANVIASNLPSPDTGLEFVFEHFVFGVINLCIIGSVLTTFRNYKGDVDELQARQLTLVNSLQQGEDALLQERRDTENTVEQVMTEALAAIGADTTEAIDRLNRASEQILRPLSHQLATSNEGISPTAISTPKPRWRSVLTHITTTPLIAPRLTALVILLLTWRISFDQAVDQPAQAAVDLAGNTVGVSIDMASFVGSLLDLASVFFGTLLAAWLVVRVTKRPLQHLNPAARWLVVVISAIAVATLAQLFITVPSSLFNRQTMFDQNVLIRLAVIIPIAAVSVILGLVRAIETAQRDVKEQLDETNSALQWQVTRINEEIWDQRRTMALVVHGPMRAALISSAMQLAKTSKTPSLEGEILEMLRSRINDARSGDLLVGQATDLLSSVRKLQELWRGTCEITVTIDQATQRQLETDSVASHAAEKIIDEACSNAITHGNATAIDITLTATNDRLDITVTNDGAPPKANDHTGLGQAFLEEATLNWSLTSGASGTKLVAALPLIG